MKILIASDFYKPTINGVVTSILNLKEGLELLGHEVRVLTLSTSIKTYEEDGVYYISSINAEKIYPDARFTIPNKKKAIEDIIEWGPDVIHTQNEFSTFFMARIIAKELSIPIVHTYHTVYTDYTHYFFKSKKVGKTVVLICTKLLGRSVSTIIAPTEKIYKILKRYGVKCPVTTIPSGISLENFYVEIDKKECEEIKRNLRIPENHLTLLSVSRIGREKRVDELIQYMKRLKGENISLVIVGDGPEREKLQRLVKKSGLSNQVKFTGMIAPSQVPTYYKMADLFVSASTSEAQGLTYIESLAAGTPILCKQDDCLDGVLEEMKNGYAFINEAEFLQKLEYFRKHADHKALSRYAKNIQTKYAKESFVNSVLNIYETNTRESERQRSKVAKLVGYLYQRCRLS
ncbi:MAG: glycosyltransferase family 4 protein [Eubacteriales bacterium]